MGSYEKVVDNVDCAFSTLVTDELVIFPWDQQVYSEGHWQPHPEIVAALKAQGLEM